MFSENEEADYMDAQEGPPSSELFRSASSSKTKVFLRIRPTSTSIRNESYDNTFVVEDSSTLLVKYANPYDFRRTKCTKSNDIINTKKYTFSKIFNTETDQSQFFIETIKPTVDDFLNNQNSTILTYGTTDAGKSYTLFGSSSEPGLIPRSIELIYSSRNCTSTPLYKPERLSNVININETDYAFESEAKERLLNSRLIDKSLYQESYEALKNSEPNKNFQICKNFIYSIWISFIEIYNEGIYDLLETDDDGKNVQLKLATDKHGVAYIQGMRSVCATTGLEAYEILNAGQTRLSTVSISNYKSSRSHSIFIIKLLKYKKDSTQSEVEVSTISFCDLAGTGKIQRLIINDKHFKESRCINTSLLVLGRCLKLIGEGHSRQTIGPFRDSKLTRLFQHSLCGSENIILLINVNPILEFFAETQSVLNFASTAMKLASEFTKEDKRCLDYHTPISSPKTPTIHLLTSTKTAYEQEIDDIILKNKQLLAELREMKSVNLKSEYIRQELADFYSKQLCDLEATWNNRMLTMAEEKQNLINFSIRGVENYYKEKLGKCIDRKRQRIDRGDFEEYADVEILKCTENIHCISKILSLQSTLESIKGNNTILTMQKNEYSELFYLKKSLKTLVELIECADNKINNFTDLKSLIIDKIDTKKLFDKDLISHLSTIADIIKKVFESNNIFTNSKGMKTTSGSKGIQCDIDDTICGKFCKEIQALLDPNFVKLPDIDDTLNLPEYVQDGDTNHHQTILLPRIKELIVENVSKIIKLEVENTEKSEQLKALEAQCEQQERDIMQTKIREHELESIRLKLEKRIKNLETKTKSKEFFKNVDSNDVNTKIFLMDNISCKHNIVEEQSSSDNLFENNFQLSLFESESKDSSSCIGTFSSNSSKNDSGLASSIEYAIGKVKDDKNRTNSVDDDNNSELNVNCTYTKVENPDDSLMVTELSQELESMKAEVARLTQNNLDRDLIINKYKNQLNIHSTEMENLIIQKQQLEMKCNELTKNVQEISKEYEKSLTESQVKTKVYEEAEIKATKTLEDYWEKSVNFGSQLSFTCAQLEKMYIAEKDYRLQIDRLEKKLETKELNEKILAKIIAEYENDQVNVNNLLGKVNEFGSALSSVEKEKLELQQIMYNKSKSVSDVESQSKTLVKKFEDCDKQVSLLKSEFCKVMRTNLSNRRKAAELGVEVAKLMGKISKMEEDLAKSEAARNDLVESSTREINNLRGRLVIFEENAKLLNLIRYSNDNKLNYTNKLEAKLLEKEKELEFYRKNRNATIQRYECLIEHLQDALRLKNQSSKARKTFYSKQKYFVANSNETSTQDVNSAKPKIHRLKSHDDENAHSLSSSNVKDGYFYSLSTAESFETNVSKDDADYSAADISEQSRQTECRSSS